MKDTIAIIAAIKCRLTQLRRPPETSKKAALRFELTQLLQWIRTGKTRSLDD